jgi:hypothetical protein
MQSEFTKKDSPDLSPSEMSEKLTTQNSPLEIGTLAAVFPVSPTASPEEKWQEKMSAIYGLNVGECYAIYDQKQCFLKTCQDYLIPMEGDSSTEFCRTFTGAGMMRNGKLYPLRNSGRGIFASGSGSSVINQKNRGGAAHVPNS